MARKPKLNTKKTNETEAQTWALRARQSAGMTHGGRRDMYDVFGYPKTISIDQLISTYRRDAIANRIIRAYPQATWREYPGIRDTQGAAGSTFFDAVEKFFDEKRIMHFVERADRLSSIGRFGILVLGFQDGKLLHEPLEANKKCPLLYLQPYGEPNVTVSKYCQDEQNPRFGLPELYAVKAGANPDGYASSPGRSFQVHWSRCIHIAEFLEEDAVFGIPRLQPIFNRLLDLEKVVGGSAETFWITADRGLAFWADKEAALEDADIAKMEAKAEDFRDRWKKVIVGSGMTAQVLGSEDPDPGPNAEKLLDLISGGSGVPKRILLGSERGELSSSQDENNWAARIDERRKSFAIPTILRPLVNLLINTGNLPPPVGSWWCEWPESASLGPLIESQVAVNLASALATYSNAPSASTIVPPQEFRHKMLNLPAESEYEDELEEDDPLPENVDFASEDGDVPPDDNDEGDQDEPVTNESSIRSLYINRPVLNAAAIIDWAQKNGFTDLVSPEEMHVTIHWSEVPVDWNVIGADIYEDDNGRLLLESDRQRSLVMFGESAIVLTFDSWQLTRRHKKITKAGAVWAYESYRPHITLSHNADNLELIGKIDPYFGAIALGPEVFAEAKRVE